MSKSKSVVASSSTYFPYASLDDYLAEVRTLLLDRKMRAGWVDELIASDDVYLTQSFECKRHPAAAALEICVTEDDATREPLQQDTRLHLDLNHQTKNYLMRLVELGVWGDSIEDVAKSLLGQAISAKMESGLLRT